MLIEHIFLGFCGLAAGLAVSAGTFAFLIVIGVSAYDWKVQPRGRDTAF